MKARQKLKSSLTALIGTQRHFLRRNSFKHQRFEGNRDEDGMLTKPTIAMTDRQIGMTVRRHAAATVAAGGRKIDDSRARMRTTNTQQFIL